MAIPKEIKDKVVQEYLTGSTLTMLADKYSVVPSTIYVWVKRYKQEHNIPHSVRVSIASNVDTFTQKDIDVLYKELMAKDIEIERLKKGYTTRGGGINKEYAILSKKNTK